MVKLISFIKITRPVNAVMASIGVVLGFWLTGVIAPLTDLILLIITAVCALGYGNAINDIKDAEEDKINHPGRPIPKGEVSKTQAVIFATLLALISLFTSNIVSFYHCVATLIPLLLLTLYTLFLKGTPLLGNIIISMLVAYTLVFGGIGSPNVYIITVPAFLAFLLNLCREIVKDMQDRTGDLKAGIHTTAVLPDKVLKIVLIIPVLVFIPAIFLPYIFRHFRLIYLSISAIIILPLHISWFYYLMGKNHTIKLGGISALIKIEMAGGLAALALDKFIYNFL